MISIIAAISDNGIIGKGGKLPWHLPADLRHFRETTQGHMVIMGRGTYESIGKPLPNRQNLVVSSIPIQNVDTVRSLSEALVYAQSKTAFIIGGRRLFEEALDRVDALNLTRVRAIVDGDVEFPVIDYSHWDKISMVHYPANDSNQYPVDFEFYTRRSL